MAAIDSLLRLVEAQKADGIVVASDRVPVLRRGGADVSLSMPKVSHDMVAMFLEDLVSPDQRAELERSGALKIEHSVGDQRFTADLQAQGGRFALRFTKAQGRQTPPAPRPAEPAPASPPPPAHVSPAPGPIAPVPIVTPVLHPLPPPADLDLAELRDLLTRAHQRGASDILLSAGRRARLRSGGELVESDVVADDGTIVALLAPALAPGARAAFERSGSADLALELQGLRFRVNLFAHHDGLAAAIRPIRELSPTLAQLGLPDDFTQLVAYPSGLVLFTGPTGSGKSSTLTALIEHINRTAARHVVTLEDPIEHLFTSRRALIHQREVGRDVATFADGLRSALRECPDVILLGEMRDPETIAAALTAAETGHLVLSTLHAAGAAMAIDRIVDVFPGEQQPQVRLQLASTLRAVVTQVLVPAARPPERHVAFERMVVTAAIASQIREGRMHLIANQIQTGRADGMIALEQTLAALVRARKVTLEAAQAVAADPETVRRLAG